MSSITKDPPSSNTEEESGWTTYLDDFFNSYVHNNNNNNKFSMSLSGVANNSSLVSDAASLVEKKVEFSLNKNAKRSSFKKRKDAITALIHDDALEDTATSPLNSPKVLYENQEIDKENRQK